jgi:hypothetical protein
MHIITVEIHVSLTGMILDPDTLGLADRIQTGCRDRLMQKVLRITIQNVSCLGIDMLSLPVPPTRRTVDISFCTLRQNFFFYVLGITHG